MTSNSPGTGRVFRRRVLAHLRLAVEEERETAARFGPAWAGYRRATPEFLSRLVPVSRPARPEV